MNTKLTVIALFLVHCSLLSQWSTSTYAESALYVCPGFEPGIITYDDGSSLVLGALSGSIYARKLDPYGNYLWATPVKLFQSNGETSVGDLPFESGTWYCSDGDGGAIVFWNDYTGAYVGPDDYYNNAVYMQRVDKNGNILWQQNGIQIASVDGGNKKIRITDDGSGGAIVILAESDFRRPGATNKERAWIQRYTNTGSRIWSFLIDSSNSHNIYPPSGVVRLDSISRFSATSGLKFIHNNGMFIDSLKYKPIGSLTVVTGSGAYEIRNLPDKTDSLGQRIFVTRVISISNKLDSLWSTEFEIPDEADENQGYGNIKNPYVSDGSGGLFFLWSFKDKTGQVRSRIQNITSHGVRWQNYGLNFKGKSAYTIFPCKNEFGIFFGDATVQRYNLDGQPVWQDSVIVLSNASEAYFKIFAPDNNGGCMIAFWTTIGGIFVQHTGRIGKVGIITKVSKIPTITPEEYELFQNYPNPFNPMTRISFTIPEPNMVELKVYDYLGREVMTIFNGYKVEGEYAVDFDARSIASGVYFYRLTSGHYTAIKKMVLLK